MKGLKARARRIAAVLDLLYPDPPVPLLHSDAYTLLIAVLLSAQCTDARVNKITPLLFQLASTPYEMARTPIEKIHAIIKPCGLGATKAKAIQSLSAQLCERFGGQVPRTFAGLEGLAGVGHKTASVVMAQAFSLPAFPVDTHIFRCARRWGLSKSKTVAGVEKDLKGLFPKARWTKLHLQIIYFAREYCQARRHDEEICPVCSLVKNERPRRGGIAGA